MPAANDESLCLGMISGTSRDGADAVLVHFHDNHPELLHAICAPYPAALRSDIDALIDRREAPSRGQAAALDESLGRFFARVANQLIAEAGVEGRDVRVIGSHGQTVWHDPDGERPVSLQLGNGSMIARATGISTVTTFRKADLLAGGQGAPLAPLLHRELLASADETRAVLNLGGIANLTLLDRAGGVRGWDTGPGNCLMDAWTRRHLGAAYDAHGEWAASGTVDAALLEAMCADPYFARPAPKSTGLEYFNMAWLEGFEHAASRAAADVQATLAELTARSVARAVGDAPVQRLLLCGGGVHNSHLVNRLQALFRGIDVQSTAAVGLDPDWIEAILFAWLARERLAERPLDTGPITGASRPVLLGRIYRPASAAP